jgi:hypothetical protein
MKQHTHVISSDRVTGTSVYNPAGEKLGSVYKVMLDKYSGRVAYALMSFGGFLGIGEKYHPLPWNALKYDTSKEGYVVDLDKKTLEGAPTVDTHEGSHWADEAWNRRVHDYYKESPYWELGPRA